MQNFALTNHVNGDEHPYLMDQFQINSYDAKYARNKQLDHMSSAADESGQPISGPHREEAAAISSDTAAPGNALVTTHPLINC